MYFPSYRMRRLRQSAMLRDLVSETDIGTGKLVYPLFVTHGNNVRNEIEAMPGCYQLSITNLAEEAAAVKELGIGAVILFGVPADKDEAASGAYDEEGIIQMAVAAVKDRVLDLLVITDVCLCEYTSHGHCGI
ncbi:MAG: porphobilinogen synthase, partial [Actinomycetota bacterium]